MCDKYLEFSNSFISYIKLVNYVAYPLHRNNVSIFEMKT